MYSHVGYTWPGLLEREIILIVNFFFLQLSFYWLWQRW